MSALPNGAGEIDASESSTSSHQIVQALDKLRYLRGKHSVSDAVVPATLALCDNSLSLSGAQDKIGWAPLTEDTLLFSRVMELLKIFEGDRDSPIPSVQGHQERRTLEIGDPNSTVDLPPTNSFIWPSDAILTVKPRHWPAECPQFCVFVFLDGEQDHAGQDILKEVTYRTIAAKQLYRVHDGGSQDLRAYKKDVWRLLEKWKKSLVVGNHS
jgi:hypothetical protein